MLLKRVASALIFFFPLVHSINIHLPRIPGVSEIPAELKHVGDEIKEYFENGIEKPHLLSGLRHYQMPNLFSDGVGEFFDRTAKCFFCHLISALVIAQRRMGASEKTIENEIVFLCKGLNIATERVCKGMVEEFSDMLTYIIDNNPKLDSTRVCGAVFQSSKCSEGDNFGWSIDLPSGVSIERPQRQNTSSETFKILHLSDIHYDPDYTPYGNAECNEPICCQSDQGQPKSNKTVCGFWSDYRNADASEHLVNETIRQTKTQDFQYVYYTGDIIAHRVWDTSIKNNTKTISFIFELFKESFQVPVFPVFGNHEPHPLNSFITENVNDTKFSQDWLYQIAVKYWPDLVGEELSETVLKGGYYTVSPRPGFRIIAINSNFCYTYNFWLLLGDVDPKGQLQWLADTLKKAEENGESVHIISHVPSGTPDTLSVWGREYSRIIERFSNTITGQFVGHTHHDEFQVYYNPSEPSKAVGVAFNGASVTPYTSSNTSYKIFEVDSSSFILRDYQEWTFNLTLANLNPTEKPDWYMLYSFVEAYGVQNLEPSEVDKVLYKMTENPELLDDYFRFFYRDGDAGVTEGCNEDCRKNNLCSIATTVYGDDTHCNRFLQLYEKEQ